MKKKRSEVILSLFIIVCLLFSFSGCFLIDRRSEDEKARSGVLFYMGIEVPMNARTVYHYETGFRDYFQYSVFQFDSEPTDWLNENSFFIEKDESFEYKFNSLWEHWSSIKDAIPAQYQVMLDGTYWGLEKRNEEGDGFLVFLPNELRLIAYIVTY